jgi:hypothetical protein
MIMVGLCMMLTTIRRTQCRELESVVVIDRHDCGKNCREYNILQAVVLD